jgi:signal transduction histidine kinase
MTGTVRGLLQLARAETIVKRPEDRLDLSALVAECVARTRPDAEAEGLTVYAVVEPGVVITAETAPLAEIVDNLLANAVKYKPAGGRVDVKLSHSGGTAVLRGTDSGTGFGAGEAEQLFDRFYRSDVPSVQAESGSGLGLAIVKAIVEAYGGEVSGRSAGPGEGAMFEVRLPCMTCLGPRSGT